MQAAVLLATYNGARFLSQQLDSLLAQDWRDYRLYVRDDGSEDATPGILSDYRPRFDGRMHLLPGTAPGTAALGPARQFSLLAAQALAHYDRLPGQAFCLAYADQDDLWDPRRLGAGIERLCGLLARHGAGARILVHSELSVIDDLGRTLHPRLSEYQGLRPGRNGLTDLLLQNTVTGCSAVLSAALARACTPVPAEAVMHDWWAALVAAATGHIDYIDRPLVAYRQHGANVFGARPRASAGGGLRARAAVLTSPAYSAVVTPLARQGAYLLEHSPLPLRRTQRLACRLTRLLARPALAPRLLALRGLRLLAALDRAHASRVGPGTSDAGRITR